MALTSTLKSWSNPKLHSDSAFRSLRLTTDKQPSPSSPSHNEIPASVPINVESITGQLHRSTMNSRAPRWIISLAKSLRAVLFVDEPFPSTRTQTMRSAQLTNISDPGFIALVSRGRLLQPQSKQHFCFLAQVSDDLPNGSGRQLDQRRSRQDMIAQNAPRVLQKIHNLYLVVIGQMAFADGAEVGDGSR